MCTIHYSGHLQTESWTGVKTLLCCNYVAHSNKSEILGSPVGHSAPNIRVPEQISGSLWLPGTAKS